MALPNQIKAARLNDDSIGNTIDNGLGDLEKALSDILGVPIDTNIVAALFQVVTGGLKSIYFQNAAGDPTVVGEIVRSGDTLKFKNSVGIKTVASVEDIPESLFIGRPGTINLVGSPNAATPNTKFDFSSEWATLLNHTTGGIVALGPTGVLTCDLAVAGPAINGRDQAGAFSASSWVHFYFIIKDDGTGLATLASASATAPTLPATYTAFVYIGAIRLDGAIILVPTLIRGDKAFYITSVNAITEGVATAETAVSLSSLIPPNAQRAILAVNYKSDNAASDGGVALKFRVVTGADFIPPNKATASILDRMNHLYTLELPNVGQQFFYIWSGAPIAGGGLDANVSAYVMGLGA